MRGAVSSHRLHRRRVRLRDITLKRASLFPFFDHEGVVRSLMLVWPSSADIFLMRYRPGLVRISRFDRIVLDCELAALRGAGAGRADELTAGCWHDDPWWLLRAQRYEGNTAVPVLKATNSSGQFCLPVAKCYFSRDLSRLTKLKGPDGDITAFVASCLPARRQELGSTRRRDWQLSPIWLRRTLA